MIYFYLIKTLPLLAILEIITTSCNLTPPKKTPNQQTSKTNQRVIQDKLCVLCMDLLKSSSTPPRWIDWEEKLAHAHLYIQPVCNSKDHPSPVPHFPTYNYTLRLNEIKSWFIFVKRPLCNIYFYWKYLFYVREKGRKQLELKKTKLLKSY